jgi:adenosylhomocysteine nucleosidase
MQRCAGLLTGSERRAMFEVAYVAALKREVSSLVRDWQAKTLTYSGRNFDFFENGSTVLVCGGVGPEAARSGSEALIALYQPKELVSVGFAGALSEQMHVGEISEPAAVIDARDGSRTPTGGGIGVLVSFASVADAEQKRKLAQAYGAQIVDMEAASVARSAQIHKLRFRAVKSVSDELEFSMPPLDDFVDASGNFHTAQFATFALMRPALWPSVVRLARNSQRAAHALCEHLRAEMVRAASRAETTAHERKQ